MTTKVAQLLEGRVLAKQIQEEIQKFTADLSAQQLPVPHLVGVQVGDHPSADWYVNQQEKLAAKIGIRYTRVRLSETAVSQEELDMTVAKYSRSHEVNGIFITMPLPKKFNPDEVLAQLNPAKDVEGIHPSNLGLIVLRKTKLIPPTAFAAFQLIKSSGVAIRGKRAVIVGQSAIVGRPLQLLLGEERATTVVCNTGTSTADLEKFVRDSDIVIGCAGQPGMIKGAWIKDGAVVIDVGTTEVNGQLAGDVEFESAKERAGFITPVPGGVGPLTVTMLMQNLVNAYRWQK